MAMLHSTGRCYLSASRYEQGFIHHTPFGLQHQVTVAPLPKVLAKVVYRKRAQRVESPQRDGKERIQRIFAPASPPLREGEERQIRREIYNVAECQFKL